MLRVPKITIIGALALALAVPAAAGAQQDLRSPDAADAQSTAVVTSGARQDLRSPDAADVQPIAVVTSTPADLRSPDVRDAAAQAGTDLRSPDVRDAAASSVAALAAATPSTAQTPAPVATDSSTGFEWGDAGIGAAGMLAIVLLVVGVGMLAIRHRHTHGDTVYPTH